MICNGHSLSLSMSVVRLTNRALVHVSGRDTFKYLQSYTTNNLARPRSLYTSFLSAQGRLLFDCFLYLDPAAPADAPACVLECDAAQRDDLVAHLKRYKLRSKFVLREIDAEELSAYAVSGHDADGLGVLGGAFGDALAQQDPRAPDLGTRVLLRPDASALGDLQSRPLAWYARRRYLRGVAEGGAELIANSALPMESNLDHGQGVDFHKGCYLGQELTVRTYHTGVIRKRILPVRIATEDAALPADLLAGVDESSDPTAEVDAPETKADVKWRGIEGRSARAGKLLATVGDVGIALLKLDGIERNLIGHTDSSNLLLKPFLPQHWPRKATEQISE